MPNDAIPRRSSTRLDLVADSDGIHRRTVGPGRPAHWIRAHVHPPARDHSSPDGHSHSN